MSYQIEWQSKITGLKGRGEKSLTFTQAQDWINQLNKDHPDIHHFISPKRKKI